MPLFILMGVSGSGKSTVGSRVAERLDIPFLEGDDFHPAANVQKMASGIALSDADRMPWIDGLVQACNAMHEPDILVACSALTDAVRHRIAAQSRRPVTFLHLRVEPEEIARRLQQRGRHFMKPGMLPSQLAALQSPDAAIAIDANPSLEEVCEAVTAQVRRLQT